MDREYGAQYEMLYKNHWWWRARETILRRELKRLQLSTRAKILDVGCGNALSFPLLQEFGSVSGIEPDVSLLTDGPYRRQISSALVSSPDYPWRGQTFDLVTAFDVVEHIEDDRTAIRELSEQLSPGGYLMITVPAFQCLWDGHDEMNHHFRRYRMSGIRRLLAEFVDVQSCRYLFHSLFPVKLLVAHFNKSTGSDSAGVQHRLPLRFVNQAMIKLLSTEHLLLSAFSLPFGSSVFAVGKKR